MANYIEKDIKIAKHYFILKIYPALEGTEDICWEIFPFAIGKYSVYRIFITRVLLRMIKPLVKYHSKWDDMS